MAKDILGYCRKNDNPVSDEECEDVPRSGKTPFEGVAFKEELNFCYMKLLRENRKEARVLYLRAVEGRSSQEVVKLLGISSLANVDQMFSRARKKMRTYLEESKKISPLPNVKADAREMEVES